MANLERFELMNNYSKTIRMKAVLGYSYGYANMDNTIDFKMPLNEAIYRSDEGFRTLIEDRTQSTIANDCYIENVNRGHMYLQRKIPEEYLGKEVEIIGKVYIYKKGYEGETEQYSMGIDPIEIRVLY